MGEQALLSGEWENRLCCLENGRTGFAVLRMGEQVLLQAFSWLKQALLQAVAVLGQALLQAVAESCQ